MAVRGMAKNVITLLQNEDELCQGRMLKQAAQASAAKSRRIFELNAVNNVRQSEHQQDVDETLSHDELTEYLMGSALVSFDPEVPSSNGKRDDPAMETIQNVRSFLEHHCPNLLPKVPSPENLKDLDASHWTTDSEPSILHQNRIASGGYGDVHCVWSIFSTLTL
jgi:hypothetical protein